MNLAINIHEQDDNSASKVERKHYTVAQLIAELSKYNSDDGIVVRNLATGKFGSIDFQGLTLES